MADYDDPEEGLFSGSLNEKNPQTNYSTQDYLDAAALTTMAIPGLGDAAGLGADLYRLKYNPEERTPFNYGMAALGMLPFMPPNAVTRKIGDVAGDASRAAAEKLGVRNALNIPVQNMNNKITGFYGGPVGKYLGAARSGVRGVTNSLEQFLTPQGLALADENMPLQLKNLVEESYKEVADIRARGEKLKVDIGSSDMPDAEKISLLEDIDNQTNRLVREVSNKVEGQKMHSYMTNVQFDAPQNPIINSRTSNVNLGSGTYSRDTFKEFFPEASEEMFDLMSSNQKMRDGRGKLVLRNAFGSAAGNLRNDAVSSHGSKIAKAARELFGEQPLTTNFKSGTNFLKKLQGLNLTAAQKRKVTDPVFQEAVNTAFRGDSPLKNAESLEEFHALLKKSGVKADKKLVEKAFQGTFRKPFKDTEELIAGLETKGVSISDAERAKALKRGYVLLTDSMLSSAIDLGGVNLVHAIYPNGRKETLINDGYDLFGVAPPGADKLVNATYFREDFLGGKNPSSSGPLKDAGPVERPTEQVPFPSQSIQQQVGTEEILNLNPTVSDKHRARAFRNQLLAGGGAGGLGYAAFGEDEEE